MRTTPRSTFLTITLVGAGLVLAACGSHPGERAAPNADNPTTHSSAPIKTMPPTPILPTNASIQAYCHAFSGDQAKFADVSTTGEAADAFENLLDHQRKVGTPANMPKETRRVFIEYLQSGADFVGALRKLPKDSPISTMRTNKDFYDTWGGKLDTPQELRDYSAKHCS